VADDPLAPAPVADTAPAADPLAPEAAAKPAARKATTVKSTAVRSRPAPARVASAAPAVAVAPAVTMAPVAAAPAEPSMPMTPEVAPVEAPVAEAPTPVEASAIDSMVPIAGAGGLGLLALAGAGLVVRRRRRRAEEAEDVAWQEHVQALPDADAEPAMAVEPQPGYMPEQSKPAFVRAFAPAPEAELAVAAESEPSAEIDGPVTELPEGFDLSRFSPQVQAAYKGPTEDNPSLSLKHRLRRAAGMDQLAEREAEAGTTAPAKAPVAKPAMAHQGKTDFMLARSDNKPGVQPTYSKNLRPAYNR
jgi:hypothetical protein